MDWHDKRVLVTGDAGFIGEALFMALLARDASPVGYDLKGGMDVCNHAQLREALEIHEVELVYHLAAQAHVPIANRHPFGTLRTNILGTLNVLDVCEHLRIPAVIASSDHAYGEMDRKTTTTSPLNARFPYDLSKACADRIAQIYIDRGVPVKIMRLCNVFGPGDTNRHRLIPYVIRCYLQGKPPELRGDPSMVRDWLFIDSAVEKYICAPDWLGPVFSFGGHRATVGAVVETLRQKIGGEPPIVRGRGAQEIHTLSSDTLADQMGDTFDQELSKTVNWWKGVMG